MTPLVLIILVFCHLKMSLFGHFFNFGMKNLPDRLIKTHLGVGGRGSILGDVLKSLWGPFFYQDISKIKTNPKKKMNFMHFWRFAPQKTEFDPPGLTLRSKFT